MSASSGYGGGGSTPVGPVVETLTGNVGGAVGPTGNNINIIGAGGVIVTGNPGTSTLTITAPGEAALYTEDIGTAAPSAGNLNIFSGATSTYNNINTFGSGDTVRVRLNDSISLPDTNTSGTTGLYSLGGLRFMHNYGQGGTNAFLGTNAGNLTYGGPGRGSENTGIGANALTSLVASAVNLGGANTAIGTDALRALTDGSWNCAMGNSAGSSITTGQGNCIMGNSAASNLTTGNTNILIGGDDNVSPGVGAAGDNYTTESSNICLQNPGVIGDNQVMRLGDDGNVDGKINSTYIAGIYNRSFASPSGVVQIDHNFKLGSSAGTNGQLLIGSTGASPLWANLTSVGGTVVITNAPNAINLEAAGTGAGASQFPTDLNGPADEIGGVLNIFGGPGILSGVNNIHTNAVALSNTVRVVLNDSLHFPITHADGSGGILYWNNVPAIQFYGSGNCFLGTGAGNLTLTTGSAIDNTAVGDNCLPALTTSPENTFIGSNSGTLLASGSGLNTAAGFAVLDNLVSGANNIAIGTLAGTNYTTNESNNILLGSFGTVSDQQTIRIGRTQTAAYMEGIYGASIGSTNAPVFIDNNGKLGTKEGAAPGLDGLSFFAYVDPNEVLPASGAFDQVNFVGALQAMNLAYDNFGTFNVGPIVGGAQFVAPIKGYYQFTSTINISFSASLVNRWFSVIYLNGIGVAVNTKTRTPTLTFNATTTGTLIVSVNLLLNVSDIITFGTITNNSISPAPEFLGLLTLGPLSLNCYQTYISGQLLKTAP